MRRSYLLAGGLVPAAAFFLLFISGCGEDSDAPPPSVPSNANAVDPEETEASKEAKSKAGRMTKKGATGVNTGTAP